jgi:hypothetical protein
MSYNSIINEVHNINDNIESNSIINNNNEDITGKMKNEIKRYFFKNMTDDDIKEQSEKAIKKNNNNFYFINTFHDGSDLLKKTRHRTFNYNNFALETMKNPYYTSLLNNHMYKDILDNEIYKNFKNYNRLLNPDLTTYGVKEAIYIYYKFNDINLRISNKTAKITENLYELHLYKNEDINKKINKEIETYKTLIETHQKDINDYKGEIKDYNNEIQKNKDEIEKFNEKPKTVENKQVIATYNHKIKKLEVEIKDAEDDIKKFTENINKYEKNCEELKSNKHNDNIIFCSPLISAIESAILTTGITNISFKFYNFTQIDITADKLEQDMIYIVPFLGKNDNMLNSHGYESLNNFLLSPDYIKYQLQEFMNRIIALKDNYITGEEKKFNYDIINIYDTNINNNFYNNNEIFDMPFKKLHSIENFKNLILKLNIVCEKKNFIFYSHNSYIKKICNIKTDGNYIHKFVNDTILNVIGDKLINSTIIYKTTVNQNFNEDVDIFNLYIKMGKKYKKLNVNNGSDREKKFELLAEKIYSLLNKKFISLRIDTESKWYTLPTNLNEEVSSVSNNNEKQKKEDKVSSVSNNNISKKQKGTNNFYFITSAYSCSDLFIDESKQKKTMKYRFKDYKRSQININKNQRINNPHISVAGVIDCELLNTVLQPQILENITKVNSNEFNSNELSAINLLHNKSNKDDKSNGNKRVIFCSPLARAIETAIITTGITHISYKYYDFSLKKKIDNYDFDFEKGIIYVIPFIKNINNLTEFGDTSNNKLPPVEDQIKKIIKFIDIYNLLFKTEETKINLSFNQFTKYKKDSEKIKDLVDVKNLKKFMASLNTQEKNNYVFYTHNNYLKKISTLENMDKLSNIKIYKLLDESKTSINSKNKFKLNEIYNSNINGDDNSEFKEQKRKKKINFITSKKKKSKYDIICINRKKSLKSKLMKNKFIRKFAKKITRKNKKIKYKLTKTGKSIKKKFENAKQKFHKNLNELNKILIEPIREELSFRQLKTNMNYIYIGFTESLVWLEYKRIFRETGEGLSELFESFLSIIPKRKTKSQKTNEHTDEFNEIY